ncbi:DMT family transporter [Marivirga sp. S37H4]|uniref:DMT family transporter n=2 Tax=Marivirga aurantiaca TaxID=2802615 RepID=A0A934X2T7_9BACT|nr:DMT family transporter [Marivirga aurantiaca]
MLIAGLFFAIMNVLVKMLPTIPAIEIVFFRSLISFVMSYAYLRSVRIPLFGNNKKWLIARGLAGAIALSMYFYTLQNIPLASAVTIQFLSPIFTSVLGIYIVKEKVKPLQWVFYLIAFIGIIVIQGFDPRISFTMFLIGILAAIFSGLAYNFIRKINTKEHPLVIVFYFPLVTLPLAGIYSAFNWVMPTGNEWYLLILIGVLTQFAQYFMTKSYQSEDLSKVASLSYFSIIYALGFGYVFFDEKFNLMVYAGIAMILSGVVLNIWYKNKIKGQVGETS